MDARAPFTDDQVVSLNAYQASGVMHPFTCGQRDLPGHKPSDRLWASTNGWFCEHCDYTQDWAHGFMADWGWARMERNG